MSGIEERFNAAVNVIKGLPKDGPYQPTTTMLLKFYALYKQGTEGPCTISKPSFWDIKGRAKWDAWHSKRHLSREQAMEEYVKNLQEIIETMSFTENVQNFVGTVGGLENINLDELELISPGLRQLAVSHPNSPFHSRNNSPNHLASGDGLDRNDSVAQDTFEGLDATTVTAEANEGTVSRPVELTTSSVEQSDDEYDDPYDIDREVLATVQQNTQFLERVNAAVVQMNADIAVALQRVESLERTVQELSQSLAYYRRRQPAWWPFRGISPRWFVLLVLIPVLMRYFQRVPSVCKR